MRKAVEIPVYATVRLCSANSRTASTCSRFTPGNHRRKSPTPAPSSRFSKRAFTGTRVPLNSHTPLTFPGTRSYSRTLIPHANRNAVGKRVTTGWHSDESREPFVEFHGFQSPGGKPEGGQPF